MARQMNEDKKGFTLSGWSEANFSRFAFELIGVMNGTYRPGFLASWHGLNFQLETNS